MAGDLPRLAADLRAAPGKAVPWITKGIEASLHDIKSSAQEDAPVYSGRYRRSISYDMLNPFKGEVGPESRYGHLVEDGGARSAPNRVMARATKKHEDDFADAMADAIMRGLA